MPGLIRGGTLVVYRDGAFEPKEFTPFEEVGLRNGTGMLHYAGGMTSPSTPPTLAPDVAKGLKFGADVPTLTWQYTTDSWAAIYWSTWETAPTRDELVTIADGLRPAQPKEFPIGFQPKYPPKGYLLLAASHGRDMPTADRVVSAVRLGLKAPPLPLTRPVDYDETSMLTLTLGTGDPPAKVVGKPQCTDDRRCTLVVDEDGTYVRLEASNERLTASSEASQLLLGIAAQDPEDRTGWPPVTKVFATP